MNALKKIVSLMFKLGVFVVVGYAGYRATKMYRARQTQLPLELELDDEPEPQPKKTPVRVMRDVVVNVGNKLNSRQQQIFDYIKNNSKAGMKELTTQIKGVTERTLRRDLQALLDARMISKKGKTKAASYSVLNDKTAQ